MNMEVEYTGGLRTRARHQLSGNELETDAPPDNEGRGERFSPTDLVATAAASCAMTIMGILARRKGFSIDGARAKIEKHMTSQPVRRIGRIVIDIQMPPDVPPSEHEALDRAAHTCPVLRSLSSDVQVDLTLRW